MSMTTSQLIAKLSQFPPDMKVVVRGYEEGLDDVFEIKTVKVEEGAKKWLWSGLYGLSDGSDDEGFEVVYIVSDVDFSP